ncbi:hypothetical protein [Natrinema salaciae]|uniref:hypothetical protein n=1 Tax=Natrinema salaciae TaxID=1186196 RepID=UPI001FE1336F|nr:hypothetical protein [Natrinema salaciae]
MIGTASVATANESEYGTTIPDDGPAYGVNSSDFYRLWSNDVDDGGLSEDEFEDGEVDPREGAERALARSTDIPFEHPPKAAEDWTRGDFQDYNSGGSEESVAPADANLTDGTYIKDAFVSIAAVQPSTILHDTNATNTTQYVAPDGEVLAVSDFRVALPDDEKTDRERVEWSLVDTSIETVTLEADGQTLSTDDGHRSILGYSNLSDSVTLEVEATISAELEAETESCTDWNANSEVCEEWESYDDTISVEQTVRDTQSVVVNQLSNVSGRRVNFEAKSDRVGAAVHPDTEWSTITVDGDIRARSNWWFYTAGTPGWDEMVTHKANGSTTSASSVRPVQVHAFPSEAEPHVPTELANGTVPLRIEETWGEERTGPELPSVIDLETASPYTNADSVALSSETLDEGALEEVTVDGIVRGQSETVTLSELQAVHEANLTLTVTEDNSTHATVRAEVTDTTTGDPVSGGRVEIGNQSVPLDQNGTAVITVQNPGLTIRGEYNPEGWWRTDQPYSSAATTTIVPREFLGFQTFVDLVIVTLLWFLPVALLAFGVDYVTNGELLGLKRHSRDR